MKSVHYIVLILFMSCTTVRTVETSVEKSADGKMVKSVQRITRKNKEFELHENFKEQTTVTIEYYRNGKTKYRLKQTNFTGPDYPCREALYELTQFDSLGIKRYYLKNECDCHEHLEITYNEKGKMLTKEYKLIKRLY